MFPGLFEIKPILFELNFRFRYNNEMSQKMFELFCQFLYLRYYYKKRIKRETGLRTRRCDSEKTALVYSLYC